MYISKAKKYRQQDDGTIVAYDYYRLTKKYRDGKGNPRSCSVLCLGALEGFTKAERNELADMLTVMIEQGQSVMSFNPALHEKALELYVKYRESKWAQENDPILREEAARKERERMRDMVTIRLDSLTQRQARTIGPEAVCRSTACVLGIRDFLNSKGWSREDVDLALMQIIARAIYPFSELKTVRYLQGNSALLEMFKMDRRKVTKDALYESARRLWEVHGEMEDFLHERVRSMFNLEEKILLVDISNAYMEGRMEGSELCFHGRSKEKRDDCKIVVLAAVVNTDGLLVRTMIYEGNRQDVTTVKEIVGTLASETSAEARKVVVMDAGFYSAANVGWLTENHFDYITVLPSGYAKFTADSDKVVRHEDCRHREIHEGTLDARPGMQPLRAGPRRHQGRHHEEGRHKEARCGQQPPGQARQAIWRDSQGVRGHLHLRGEGKGREGRRHGLEAQAGQRRREEQVPRQVCAADQP